MKKPSHTLLDFNISFEPGVTVEEVPGILDAISENIQNDIKQMDADSLLNGGIVTDDDDKKKLAIYSYSWKRELK